MPNWCQIRLFKCLAICTDIMDRHNRQPTRSTHPCIPAGVKAGMSSLPDVILCDMQVPVVVTGEASCKLLYSVHFLLSKYAQLIHGCLEYIIVHHLVNKLQQLTECIHGPCHDGLILFNSDCTGAIDQHASWPQQWHCLHTSTTRVTQIAIPTNAEAHYIPSHNFWSPGCTIYDIRRAEVSRQQNTIFPLSPHRHILSNVSNYINLQAWPTITG